MNWLAAEPPVNEPSSELNCWVTAPLPVAAVPVVAVPVVAVSAVVAPPAAGAAGPAAARPVPLDISTAGAKVDSEVEDTIGDRTVATVLFLQAEVAASEVVEEFSKATQLSET